MHDLAQRISRSAVAWSLVATGLRFGSALFILPLMLQRISAEELGLWYVFVALEAFAVLLDLGFGHAATRAFGYLWAGSQTLLPFGISAPAAEIQPNLPMLSDLIVTLRAYYRVTAALLFLLLSSAGGAWVWHKSAGLTNAGSLRLAFVAYAFSVSLGFAANLWPSLLSGINAVRAAQQIICVCSLIYLGVGLTGLLLGWKFWALIAGSIAAGCAELILGKLFFRRMVSLPAGKFNFDLLRALWPNAWRTAAVGLGAFMILQANTLICSAFLDLRTTASYGLSLQAVTLLVGLSSIWVTVKLPAINHLRAQGSIDRIAPIFRARIILAVLTFLAGAIVLLSLGEQLLLWLHSQTALLPGALLALLLLINLLEMHHALYGELVYSENLNPFVRSALLTGVAIIILSMCLTARFGVLGMLASAGLAQICFNNWWPILRAVRGLGPAGENYWRGFIGAPQSNAGADDR